VARDAEEAVRLTPALRSSIVDLAFVAADLIRGEDDHLPEGDAATARLSFSVVAGLGAPDHTGAGRCSRETGWRHRTALRLHR
jgi:hypothetical protein